MRSLIKMGSKIRPHARLTWSIVSSFSGRKKPGRISILVDTVTGNVYVVPRKQEHVDYAKEIFGINAPEFLPPLAKNIIPSHLEVLVNPETGMEEVTSIHTGDCGLEIRYGVRHSRDALYKGHKLAKCFVFQGEVPVAETLRESVNERYVLQTE